MPEHPIIPPIDPAFIVEVHELTIEAQQLLMSQLAPLCERVGATLMKMESLEEAVDQDDEAINKIRDRLNYGVLLGTMAMIASHAGQSV